MVGLATWSAQLWNMVIHGEDLASLSLGTEAGSMGDILHTASDVLRAFPQGMQPVFRLQTLSHEQVPEGFLRNLVRQNWSSFSACGSLDAWPGFSAISVLPFLVSCKISQANQFSHLWRPPKQVEEGKRCPSTLICESTFPIYTTLIILVKFFKLQCRRRGFLFLVSTGVWSFADIFHLPPLSNG